MRKITRENGDITTISTETEFKIRQFIMGYILDGLYDNTPLKYSEIIDVVITKFRLDSNDEYHRWIDVEYFYVKLKKLGGRRIKIYKQKAIPYTGTKQLNDKLVMTHINKYIYFKENEIGKCEVYHINGYCAMLDGKPISLDGENIYLFDDKKYIKDMIEHGGISIGHTAYQIEHTFFCTGS